MIKITKNTKSQITFEKDTWEETWFNNDCSDENLKKQCNRENDTILAVKFDDGNYIGSILHVYFKTESQINIDNSEQEKFNTNSEIGSHHWFQTLLGQCIRMSEFIEKNPHDKRIQEFEYGKKIKETLIFIGKNHQKINTVK